MLHQLFDHTVIVAFDDPNRKQFQAMEASGLIDLRLVDAVGCESFAKLIFDRSQSIISSGLNQSARVHSVEVLEHGANSAIYSA
jgi:6-pyruvoyltetrahydropterin/6-carboxytetrahydropterin synthase